MRCIDCKYIHILPDEVEAFKYDCQCPDTSFNKAFIEGEDYDDIYERWKNGKDPEYYWSAKEENDCKYFKPKEEKCMEKSNLVTSCFVENSLDNQSFEKGIELNVKNLRKVLEVLEDEGFGDYRVSVGYDSNYAYCGIYNDFHISNKEIRFQE